MQNLDPEKLTPYVSPIGVRTQEQNSMPRGIKGTGPNATVVGLGKKLSNLVVKATQADLDDMDAELAEREAELRGLKALRECLAERVLNSPKAGETKSVRAAPIHASASVANEPVEVIRKKVLTWMNRQGPTTDRVIQKEFGLTHEMLAAVMDCKYFAKKFKTWEITSDGYVALEIAKDDSED